MAHRVPNYGLLVRIRGDDIPIGVHKFASPDHENALIRPRLTVCLTAMMPWRK